MPITFASHGTSTFTTINGLAIGGGLAFAPTYNATNLTLTVGPSPSPGLDQSVSQTAVPLANNNTTVNYADASVVTNSLNAYNKEQTSTGLTLDYRAKRGFDGRDRKQVAFLHAAIALFNSSRFNVRSHSSLPTVPVQTAPDVAAI